MGILALNERTGIVALAVLVAHLIPIVHRTEYVGLAVLSCLLILYGARLVDTLYPVVHALEVLAIAGLVAHRPDNDAGMVAQQTDVGLVALQVHLRIVLTLGQRLVAIAHAVTFEIGFGRDVDACFIAEVVPTRVVGIVRGAHGIDVQLFHDGNILAHALFRDQIATVGIKLVAVYTFY